MLIGNRWCEHTRLKILNGYLSLGAAWATYTGLIATNLSERGFLCGLTHMGGDSANTVGEMQILFDGKPPHQGTFRFGLDNLDARISNQQPTTMAMPAIDIAVNTTITVRGRIVVGAVGVDSYVDLFAVVYYVEEWEAALPVVCFPTDMQGPNEV